MLEWVGLLGPLFLVCIAGNLFFLWRIKGKKRADPLPAQIQMTASLLAAENQYLDLLTAIESQKSPTAEAELENRQRLLCSLSLWLSQALADFQKWTHTAEVFKLGACKGIFKSARKDEYQKVASQCLHMITDILAEVKRLNPSINVKDFVTQAQKQKIPSDGRQGSCGFYQSAQQTERQVILTFRVLREVPGLSEGDPQSIEVQSTGAHLTVKQAYETLVSVHLSQPIEGSHWTLENIEGHPQSLLLRGTLSKVRPARWATLGPGFYRVPPGTVGGLPPGDFS